MKFRLAQVGTALNVESRVLRYIVEQEVVSGIGNGKTGRGTARELTQRQARLVGLAAVLHQRGLRGDTLKAAVRGASSAMWRDQEECTVQLKQKDSPIQMELKVVFGDLYERL